MSVAPCFQECAAALCFIADDPQVSAVVDDVCSFILDIELTSPGSLILKVQMVCNEVFEKELAPFGLMRESQVAVGDAAENDRALGVDFDAPLDGGEVLERDDR